MNSPAHFALAFTFCLFPILVILGSFYLSISSTACMLSRVQLCATPWTVAQQAPLSMGCSRQEYWSGLPFPPPGYLPNLGIELASLASPALAGESLPLTTPKAGLNALGICIVLNPCFQKRKGLQPTSSLIGVLNSFDSLTMTLDTVYRYVCYSMLPYTVYDVCICVSNYS